MDPIDPLNLIKYIQSDGCNYIYRMGMYPEFPLYGIPTRTSCSGDPVP